MLVVRGEGDLDHVPRRVPPHPFNSSVITRVNELPDVFPRVRVRSRDAGLNGLDEPMPSCAHLVVALAGQPGYFGCRCRCFSHVELQRANPRLSFLPNRVVDASQKYWKILIVLPSLFTTNEVEPFLNSCYAGRSGAGERVQDSTSRWGDETA
jgi:hypothetical protein